MNHNRFLVTIALLLFSCVLFGQVAQNKVLLRNLTMLIQQKDYYTKLKERKIKEAIDLLKVPEVSATQRYAINQRLFDEFKTYISDSAVY